MAVFHYEGAPNANPTTDPSVNIPVIKLPLNETDLHVSRMFYIYIFTDEIIFSTFLSVQPLVPTHVVNFYFMILFYSDL